MAMREQRETGQSGGQRAERSGAERRISRVLTLHAHPIGAVLGLEHHALTVLPPVFGCRSAAFSPPPVGALCPTGGPLTPLCPQAIHYHATDKDGRGLSG